MSAGLLAVNVVLMAAFCVAVWLLAAGHLQIGAHPCQHPLQTGDVLVDLLAVVATQNDV